MTKRRVRAGLLLLVGLVVGFFAVLAVLQHGGRASATPAATCSVSGGVATVSLVSGTPTLTVDSLHELVVDGTLPACGVLPGGVAPNITSISIVVASGQTPAGVLLDQSSGRSFPCGVPIGATTIGALSVEVDGGPGQALTAGVNTVSSTTVNQVNTAACGAGPNLSLSSTASLDLKGATGPVNLSAGGGSGFAGPSTVATTLDGSTSGAATPDIFVAGNGAETFNTASPGSTLDFSNAFNGIAGTNTTCPTGTTCTLTANSSIVPTSGLNQYMAAVTNGGPSPLATYTYATGGSDFTTIKGLSSGSTNVYLPGAATMAAATTYNLSGNNVIAHGTADSTFYALTLAGPGTAAAGSGNQVVAGPGTETFAVTGTGLSVVGGPGTDTFTVTPPSTQATGNNSFVAGSGNDSFYAAGAGNTTNTVDFSKVQTSSAGVGQLAINVTGGLQGVGPSGNTPVENGQAALGSMVPYTFSTGPNSTDASPFTNFIGANNGNTQFLAGGSGGLTFTGGGSANSASLLTPTGVVVNLSGGTQTPSTNLGPSTPLTGFTVGSGLALVAPPTGTPVPTSCSGTPLPTFCDSLVDVGAVTGPPTIGYSTFYAGSSPGTFTFSDAGDHNTFIGGSGTDVFSSAGNFNTFVPGSGPATFNESGPSQGASNTIDFSNVPVGRAPGCTGPPCSLSVNVSGSPLAVGTYQAAVLSTGGPPVATYNFGTGGSEFTNFIGAAGGLTTFDGGQGQYTYTGQGAGNSLDFSGVAQNVATTLTFDVTHIPNPQATLGGVPETFSGITNLVGLASGNTQFQGGSTGGYTFKGNGSGNQASFSAQGPSTTLTVGVNSAVAGGTVTFSLAGQTTPLCSPVPVTILTSPPPGSPNGTATCLASALPAGTDQVLAIYTPPAGSTQSGSGVALTPTVTTGQAAPPATTTNLTLPPSPTYQGQQVSLSATVTSGVPLPAGAVAFSEAGGTALCTAPVSAGPTSETVACPPGFSFPTAGAYDVTAVYTPNGSSVSGSADEQPVTVQAPTFYQTSVSIAPGDCAYGNHNSPPFPFSGFYPACQATVQVQGNAINLPGGTFTFSTPDGSQICSDTFGPQSSPSKTEFCFFPALSNGDEIIGTYSPTPSSDPSVVVSGSAGLAQFSDPFSSGQATNTTSLSSLATSPTAGTRVTLSATVTSSAGALPAGGTMFFKVAGGTTLCSVPVPGGSTTATLQCSTSFVGAGFDDVVVAYSPPSSSSILGSADQKTVQVIQPTSTTVVGTPAQEDAAPGVVVNLSATAVSGTLHIGTIANTTSIQVGGGQVLVAAPPAGTSSCSGSPVPSFCDNLVDISLVNGSSQGHNTFVAGSGNETFGDTGSSGGDAIDFSNVATSGQTPLMVNATGSPIGLMAIDTATVGGTTYTFNQGGSNFTSFVGAANGNTSFLAGSSPGYTFTGAGSNNSIDFSAVGSGVTVDLHAGPFPAKPVAPNVTLPAGTDTIVGLTTVVGSSGGNNTFKAGPAGATYTFTGNGDGNDFVGGAGPDVFTSNGSDNTFTAGAGNATFNDAGSSNTVDLSALSGTSVVDVSGMQAGATANDTATSGNSTYTFTSFGIAPTTFNGSKGGTTFYAGTVGDTFRGSGTTGDTLSFADTPSNGPLTIAPAACQTGQPPAGQASLSSVTEPFCGIEAFDGLPTGNTTFVTDGTPGLTFNATGTNNAADFSADTHSVVADLSAGTVQVGASVCIPLSNCDSISGVTSVLGSNHGGNTFIAGSGSETFGDAGGAGGDAIDFSHVQTSPTTFLTVNVSGGPVNGQTNDTAVVGASTYTFTRGGPGFTTFTGSGNGNTNFLAGGTSGYTFNGAGNDSIDFSAVHAGVIVSLQGGPFPTPVVPNVTLPAGAGTDTITGVTTVIGSSSGGNQFVAGGTSGSYSFTGNGNNNTFTGGAGPDLFSSNGNNNTFVAGTGSATFNDPGANNTIDFTAVPGPLTVDVSGVQVGGTANDTASGGGGPYTFTSFGAQPTTFKGSGSGGTTFDAGFAPDTFLGNGSTVNANTLSFAYVLSNGPLSISPAALDCSAFGQTMLGSVKEPFCGIEDFAGLANGNTTFAPAPKATGGFTFVATGSNNTADFSFNANPVTANLSNLTAYGVAPGEVQVAQLAPSGCGTLTNCDTVTGVSSVLGSKGGHNTFVAGIGSETFGDSGNMVGGGGDAIDFSGVVTSPSAPLTVNVSGTQVAGVSNDTASIPSATYNFSNVGSNFTSFTGSLNGFTKFAASGATGGYMFSGGPNPVPGDTADFSANLNGITANLSPSTEPVIIGGIPTGVNLAPNQVSVAPGTNPATTQDTIGGMTTVIGSPFGANTFYGGLTGTTFTSTGSTNTLSYVGVSSLAPHGAGVTFDLNADHVALRCITPSPCNPTGPPTIATQTDSFNFGSGSGLNVQGSPGNDSFVIGTSAVSISGGGGSDTLDLSQVPASSGTTGATVNLATGTVSDTSIGGVSFTPGCTDPTKLCVTSIVGSTHVDTYVVNSGGLAAGAALSIKGSGGNDTLDLSNITTRATVTMPTASLPTGTVTGSSTGSITFTGVSTVNGTNLGGDTLRVGSGTESFDETGVPGTLDYSALPANAATGINITTNQGYSSGTSSQLPGLSGTASSPTKGLAETFTDISKFVGSPTGDTTLNLLGAPGWNINFTSSASCPGSNDGTAGPVTNPPSPPDVFSCMGSVFSNGTQVFIAGPGQKATLNGGGAGILELNGSGILVDLSNAMGKVTFSDGSTFLFSGMSTINALDPGDNGVTFANAPAPVDVNLSKVAYTIPPGLPSAGSTVQPGTATGGNGTTYTLKNMSNVIGTTQFSDTLVASPGPGTLVGGAGNDRFVLSGGDTFISGGTGTGTTLDMSQLKVPTSLNLGSSSPQNTGSGIVTVQPGTIHTVIASPAGSQLQAGNGNVTLIGGPGNDWLAGGNGMQTLIGGGGTDTLVAGVGNQTLEGGAQPVTFVPGKGNDTLISSGTGNTLSYATAPPTANCTTPGGPICGVEVNLSSQLFPIPLLSPMPGNAPTAGTVLLAMTASGGWGPNPLSLSQANITNVIGSAQADIIVTGTAGGVINGDGGNDLIVASSGNNTLTAGIGTATRFLFVGAGNNVINGGGAATVDFSQAPGPVTVNLETGTATGGFGGFQSLVAVPNTGAPSVLNAIGTNFNDTLVAGAPGETIIGLNGTNGQGDFLQAGPIGGDTLISGGGGNDTFCAEDSCAIGGVAGGINTNHMIGGIGEDTFFVRNSAFDVVDGGGGFNQAQADPLDSLTNIQSLIP